MVRRGEMVRPEVRHEPERSRFVAEVDGQECVLDYERRDQQTLDYRHTFTPPALRGRGIASRVVRHALGWAEAHGQRVVATCPFVKDYIERHPEARAPVAKVE